MRALLIGITVIMTTLPLAGCAGRTKGPATVVGKLGSSLDAQGVDVPRGGEACALEQALAAPAGTQEKVPSEACSEAIRSDVLWQTATRALAAYARTLDAVANDADPQQAGPVEAQLVGIRGEDWVAVEAEPEVAARKATWQLVEQMQGRTKKDDVESVVKAAAPHVVTLCDGLLAYLGDQSSRFEKVTKDLEGKVKSPATRRCTTVNGQTVCVGNSVTDHVANAAALDAAAGAQQRHDQARNAVAGFCVAHLTLTSAVEDGKAKDDATYEKITSAVHDAVPVGATTPAEAEPAK